MKNNIWVKDCVNKMYIEVTNLSFKYNENFVLNNINFSVKEGEKQSNQAPNVNMGRRSMYGGFGNGPVGNPNAKKAKIEIIDGSGTVIRTLTVVPKTGINRTYWGLDKKGFRWPNQSAPRPGSPERGGGGYAVPGAYTLKFTYQDATDSTLLTVKSDPRLEIDADAILKNQEILKPILKKVDLLAEAYDRIKESKEAMATIKKITPKKKDDKLKNLRDVTKEVEAAMKTMTADMLEKENVQGIFRNPDIVTTKIRGIRSAIYSMEPLNDTELLSLKQAEEVIDNTLEKVNKFYEEEWPKYRTAVEDAEISPFKDYKPLK